MAGDALDVPNVRESHFGKLMSRGVLDPFYGFAFAKDAQVRFTVTEYYVHLV